jgi:UDP-N-acetylglucosamine:LPS N-acetylglucosamine transferase
MGISTASSENQSTASSKKILIAPLNWGLGHATRVIPVIRELLNRRNKIVIAASGGPLSLLRREFPELEYIEFPDYGMSYSKYISPVLKTVILSPLLLYRINSERRRLRKIVKIHKIDFIISDNRYGLYHPSIPSVLITHQILIKPPRFFAWTESYIWWLVTGRAQKFTFTWIPDNPAEPFLSGDLSHKFPIPYNGRFIGLLSSIKKPGKIENFDILIMISGPEPARSNFEKIVMAQIEKIQDKKTVILLGKPENSEEYSGIKIRDNIRVYSHCSREKISSLMAGADMIISRPGYTTVMEVAALGKKAHWVPTPGQTEQEYLAGYLEKKGWYAFSREKDFDISGAVMNKESYNPPKFTGGKDLLSGAVDELLSIE